MAVAHMMSGSSSSILTLTPGLPDVWDQYPAEHTLDRETMEYKKRTVWLEDRSQGQVQVQAQGPRFNYIDPSRPLVPASVLRDSQSSSSTWDPLPSGASLRRRKRRSKRKPSQDLSPPRSGSIFHPNPPEKWKAIHPFPEEEFDAITKLDSSMSLTLSPSSSISSVDEGLESMSLAVVPPPPPPPTNQVTKVFDPVIKKKRSLPETTTTGRKSKRSKTPAAAAASVCEPEVSTPRVTRSRAGAAATTATNTETLVEKPATNKKVGKK